MARDGSNGIYPCDSYIYASLNTIKYNYMVGIKKVYTFSRFTGTQALNRMANRLERASSVMLHLRAQVLQLQLANAGCCHLHLGLCLGGSIFLQLNTTKLTVVNNVPPLMCTERKQGWMLLHYKTNNCFVVWTINVKVFLTPTPHVHT